MKVAAIRRDNIYSQSLRLLRTYSPLHEHRHDDVVVVVHADRADEAGVRHLLWSNLRLSSKEAMVTFCISMVPPARPQPQASRIMRSTG
jgi:hypothetical protein